MVLPENYTTTSDHLIRIAGWLLKNQYYPPHISVSLWLDRGCVRRYLPFQVTYPSENLFGEYSSKHFREKIKQFSVSFPLGNMLKVQDKRTCLFPGWEKTFIIDSSFCTFLCLSLESKFVFIHKLSELDCLQKSFVGYGQMPTFLSFGTINERGGKKNTEAVTTIQRRLQESPPVVHQ